ncbi:MAG TPA: hypothetical protein VEX64_05930 [Pyrinomonadaceae bacterium]|jgi:hypothetical protein|nr:hypothetical protein [Pyrinomonadaceae bacterium]
MNLKKSSGVLPFIILAFLSGCNLPGNSPAANSNQAVVTNNNSKTLIDQAADMVFGTEKTGIPECDKVLVELEKQNQSDNQSTLDNAKRVAARQVIYNLVREKTGTANMSQQDKAFYGKRCEEIAAPFMSAPAQK